MGGQAAEQIIAGVVLSERLAVTMYGAIHRAQFSGHRNLRGLVVDPKLLAESSFRIAVSDRAFTGAAIALDHAAIVPTLSVEQGGPDVVVVTRGVGRYVTVQDLIGAARANRKEGGRLSLPVAAAIGRSVVEALAAAHAAGVVHGAVHPRSVLVDEDGGVRLGDFVVGHALTMAVAQGADSVLWRGLAGYLAPELVVGEDPTPSCDVFACGAMLFTMLSGEVPPGTLHVTPAVERLVQRALDTDLGRRYRSAADLLENMLEAFEDDRWEIADRREVIRAAGLSRSDANIDDATEDLLASLNNSSMQVTPMRPSMDSRAEAVAARHGSSGTGQNRLDALLADLDDSREHTAVEEIAFKRDPISELIQLDPRKREAIVQVKPRVPSLDDPDDETPLPAPQRDSDSNLRRARPNTRDEVAAIDAITSLDQPVNRMSSAAEVAEQAAAKLELAAARAEAAAARVDTEPDPRPARIASARPVVPIIEPVEHVELKPPRLRSRLVGVVGLLVAAGGAVGIYHAYKNQQEANAEARRRQDEAAERARKQTDQLTAAQADPGAIEISSTPGQAGVWLRIGRTPVETMRLDAATTHELGLVLDGYQLAEVQITAASWAGEVTAQKATVKVELKRREPDRRTGKPAPAELPVQPTAVHGPSPRAGAGPIRIESTPGDAEAYLFIGITGTMRFGGLTAGRDYELVVVKPGYQPRRVTVRADDWRDGGDPNMPIDLAPKKTLLQRTVELEAMSGKPGRPDGAAPRDEPPASRRRADGP